MVMLKKIALLLAIKDTYTVQAKTDNNLRKPAGEPTRHKSNPRAIKKKIDKKSLVVQQVVGINTLEKLHDKKMEKKDKQAEDSDNDDGVDLRELVATPPRSRERNSSSRKVDKKNPIEKEKEQIKSYPKAHNIGSLKMKHDGKAKQSKN